MKKIILFARVSTMMQTLESQIKELENEALRQGYEKNSHILIQMKESAVTLDTEERQGIKKLKEYIEEDKDINAVVIYEISRLSRRPKVLYEMRDWLIERHINLICLKPYMILLDEEGKMSQTANLLFSLFGSMAESEGYIRKERMSRGKRAKKAAGGYIGGTPLWGYKVDETGQVVIDNELKPVIQKIYDRYEAGESWTTLGQWLIDIGVFTGNLNAAVRKIGTVISRIEYTGECPNDTYPYEQIISKEQYDRCTEIRHNKHKEHAKLKKTALCKGLLYSKSGHLLSPNIAKKQYKLYLIDKTENMTIHFNIIDAFVWDKALRQHKIQSKVGHKKRIQECQNIRAEAKQIVGRYLNLIRDIEKQIDRTDRRIIEGKINEVRGDMIISELNEKKQSYEEERNSWMRKGAKAAVELEILSYGEAETYNPNELNDAEKNNFVKQYIDKIIFEKTLVKRGHYKMTIYYKYSEPTTHYLWSSGPWNHID